MSSNEVYPEGVYEHVIQFSKNLQHLSVTGFCVVLVLENCPLTACSSSTLNKLCVCVGRFEDCLALLDGRLKNLTSFSVAVSYGDHVPLIVYNMVSQCYLFLSSTNKLLISILFRMIYRI